MAFLLPVEGAKATASGSITAFAGGNGQGLGIELGQIPRTVLADNTTILSGEATRRLVRSLDRATGIQTVVAGNGTIGPHPQVGHRVIDDSFIASDIERVGSDLYYASDTVNLVLRVDSAGIITAMHQTVNTNGIAVAPDGTIYYGDAALHGVYRIVPNGTRERVAGPAGGGAGYADGPGDSAQFNDIRDLELNGNTLYVADNLNHFVRAIDLSSPARTVTTVAGNGTNAIDAAYSGPALGGGFRAVFGLDMLDADDLLVATGDGGTARIVHLTGDPSTNTMQKFAGGGSTGRPPTTPPGSDPAVANLGRVYDVSAAPDGSVALAADLGLYVVEGGLIRRVAGNFTTGRGGDGLSATDPRTMLLLPRGIATDAAGNAYIADSLNDNIRKVDLNGVITRVAGPAESFTPLPVGDNGPATSAALNPTGVALDRQGNMYVTDLTLNRVRKIDLNGVITTFAGTGVLGSTGDGGPATSAQVAAPWGIAVDSKGNVYVTEIWETKVRRIDPSGTITTFYDAPGTSVPATGASKTRGIAIGPDDSVYISDVEGDVVIRIPATGGAPTVVAGNGTTRNTSLPLAEGVPATSVSVINSAALAVDHAGNLYLNDFCAIRKVDAVTGLITTVAGNNRCAYTGIGGPARNAVVGSANSIAIAGTDLLVVDESAHTVYRVADVVPPPPPPVEEVLTGKMTWSTDDGYGNQEIVVSDPDGSNRVRLTNAPGVDAAPDFSADGSHVAFLSDRSGNVDIWTATSDGSGLTNLTPGSAVNDTDPAWSPTEERLAFVRQTGPFDLITINADGTNEINVTDVFPNGSTDPSWTRNGQDLLFSARTNEIDFEIQRIPATGGALPVELTNNASEEADPEMSPDGSQIAYASTAGGDWDIWLMNADGSNQRRLTTDPATEMQPSFSPDGKYITFTVGAGELWRIRTDGTNRTQVLPRSGAASWVDNFSVFPTMPHIPAQPASVEGGEVLLQPKAPAIASSPLSLSLANILGSPLSLSLANILGSPLSLSLANILGSPGSLSLANILGSPGSLSLANILGSPGSLSLANILGSPGLRTALDDISLTEIPIEGGWESYFDDGEPIQSKSLLDALESGRAVPLFKLDVGNTPLATVSLLSYFIGQTQLRDIADTATEARWCASLEPLDDAYVATGQTDAEDCGAPRFAAPNRAGGTLSSTLIELQLQGIPLSLFPELATLTVDGVRWDHDNDSGNLLDTPFEVAFLNNADLAASDLGAITVGQLASAGVRDRIVNCDAVVGICEPTEHLAFVQSQGAIRPSAHTQDLLPIIGQYNLLLTVIGLLPASIRPLEAVDPDSAIFTAVDEPAVGDIGYNTVYSPVGVAEAHEPTITITLPSGFLGLVGSASASLDNGAPVPVTLTQKGRNVSIRLEGMSVPAGSTVAVGFSARPGQLLSSDRRLSARITAPGVNQMLGNRSGVTVMERFEPENNVADTPTTPVLEPDTMYLTHIGEPGDVDYFTLPLNAGDRVRLLLDQPAPDVQGDNADLDLVVYAPQAAATAPLRATVDSGEAIVPVFDNPNRLGEPLQPDIVQEINLLPKPVAGLSTNRGGFNESVNVLAPVTGNYVVQVSGFGNASSSHAYSLQGTMEKAKPAPSCPSTPRSVPAVPESQRGTFPSSVAGKSTLVLMNQSRLYGLYDDAQVDALVARTNSFVSHPSVSGAVLGLDAVPSVNAAYAAWDADPCSVDLANQVVRSINAAVDSRVNLASGSIKHIVVVGSDDILPMARIPDLTQASNERGYADALAGVGSLSTSSALAAGNILSDDPYGDAAPAPYLGRHLYVSDVGLGRLVEAPLDIAAQFQSYLDTFADGPSANDGRLDKSTALTAGDDFMKDVATEIDGVLDGLTGASSTADNQLINDDWVDDDLTSRFTNASPDIVSLNAHFSHDALMPARYRDESDPRGSQVTTADLHGGTFTNGVVFSMGCHSGLNVPDIVVGSSNPGTRDWAEALSAKKATFVGQTGFGYGLQHAIALSEDVMLGFARNLTTTMSVGEALAFAKHDYLGGIGVYGVYDEKALAQATLYGLPLWKVGTNPIAGPPAPRPLTVDGRTGLNTASFDHGDTFTQHSTNDGTYWSGSAGTVVVHDRPIQPRTELDVTQPNGLVAHGAEITALTSDEVSANPVFARVVLDDASRETEREDDTVVFPAALQRVNSVASPNGERDRLVLMTGQYRATGTEADGDVTGAQRFYRRMAGKVHYSTSSDFTKPDILRTEATEQGDTVAFAVTVDDALGAASVKAVSVLYHAVGEGDAGTDQWTRIELARDPSDAKQWLGTGAGAVDGDGDDIEYLVVAVDAAGNTADADRKGGFFAAAAPVAPPAGVTASVDGQSTANGWYASAEVVLDSDDDSTFEYSVDDGPWQPYTEPIPVTGDGTHEVEYRTSGGESGRVVVPVDASAPTVGISSPVNGATFAQGATVAADYACTDAGSGIARCAGPVADGAAIDTATPGTKTFTVNATDGAGYTATLSVTYTVTAPPSTYRFEGFFKPVTNGTLNTTNAGQTVPLKWRLYTSAGQPVTSTSSVTNIRSFTIDCQTGATVGGVETYARSGVYYDLLGSQFTYNWTTKKAWEKTCRRMEFTFTGGLVRYADFRFVK